MEGCVFCQIVKGTIPTKIVWEDDEIAVFPDKNPGARLAVEKLSWKARWRTLGQWGKVNKALRKFSREEARIRRGYVNSFINVYSEKYIYTRYLGEMMQFGLPAVIESAKTPKELDEFLVLVIMLSEQKVKSYQTLCHLIPAAVNIAKTPEELKEVFDLLEEFVTSSTGKRFEYDRIPEAIIKVSKTPDELQYGLKVIEVLALKIISRMETGNMETGNWNQIEWVIWNQIPFESLVADAHKTQQQHGGFDIEFQLGRSHYENF